MNDRVRRIHELIGRLSEATWARVQANRERWPEVIFEESPPHGPPVSDEEKVAWSNLTSPGNYDDFNEYLHYWDGMDLNEFAQKLHIAIKTEILRRRNDEPSKM